ncbi:MAG: hypothetical protein LLG04_18605 [Parachlamydia sp.]|nr:hypothetical protein [Parachlamydia sp.]
MDPASSSTTTPFGSPMGSPIVPPNGLSTEAANAFRLYETSQKLVPINTTTDKLAQAIFHALDEMQIYQFDNTPELSVPYKVAEVKKHIYGPFDILHSQAHIIYMFLINNNNFKLYFNQKTKIYEIDQQIKEVVVYPECDNAYVIFLSVRKSIKLKIQELKHNNEKENCLFYHYCPLIKQSNEAPFHHEAQPKASSSTCGLHAVNAYIGYRYLSPGKFDELIERWCTISKYSGLQETNSGKFSGLDPTTLKFILETIAIEGGVSSVNYIPKLITCSTNPTELGTNFSDCENELLEDFKCIDRFILGVSKSEAHFLAFRKDKLGVWWKIDSKLSKQESYADAQALIDEIKTSYDSDLLHFIIPDRNQKVRRSSDNVTVS